MLPARGDKDAQLLSRPSYLLTTVTLETNKMICLIIDEIKKPIIARWNYLLNI